VFRISEHPAARFVSSNRLDPLEIYEM